MTADPSAMKFSRVEENRGDRLFDVLTDEENGLRLIVSRLGAELISVARRDANGDWIGFLHRDNEIAPPPKGWANHATVMGYFLHRIKNERTLYRGQEMRGGTHSFLRTKIWHRVESAREHELVYRITPADCRFFQIQERRTRADRARRLRFASRIRGNFVRFIPIRNAGRTLSASFFAHQLSKRRNERDSL